ncbi:2OG-Fe(II) oxygenase [Sphingosinicella sp.]|uniref:2OG-Fe(II) oxygenase n=1 Tax=Sphingosinicella sp. TaxID=1917971 RepID=UPI00263986C5|nr:2OG-Fe(II) oxygenase [Sphingosinicella sp.]
MTIALDWNALETMLEERSYAVTPPLLDADTCGALAESFNDDAAFRSTVVMARHGYGRGRYRYFAHPLPPAVASLREALYPHLARIANGWAERLGLLADWPPTHAELIERCRAAGQMRPTPLLLRYGPGDYNCLHQDLYGPVHFPLQAVVQLDRPGADFDGGALVIVENRPRRQSRCEAVLAPQGAITILPVRDRPRQGPRGAYRTQLRHGVSSIERGERRTLGIIFHDAL